jgi:CRISPR-associated protein Csx16
MDYVIVTRHQPAIDWLKLQGIEGQVINHVTSLEQIKDKIVIGNLPLHLACEAQEVWSIELDLPPNRRGTELTIDDMQQYNARLERYKITRLGIANFEHSLEQVPSL